MNNGSRNIPLRSVDTFGTPPGDPWGTILSFILCGVFMFAGALASLMGSLDQLAKVNGG